MRLVRVALPALSLPLLFLLLFGCLLHLVCLASETAAQASVHELDGASAVAFSSKRVNTRRIREEEERKTRVNLAQQETTTPFFILHKKTRLPNYSNFHSELASPIRLKREPLDTPTRLDREKQLAAAALLEQLGRQTRSGEEEEDVDVDGEAAAAAAADAVDDDDEADDAVDVDVVKIVELEVWPDGRGELISQALDHNRSQVLPEERQPQPSSRSAALVGHEKSKLVSNNKQLSRRILERLDTREQFQGSSKRRRQERELERKFTMQGELEKLNHQHQQDNRRSYHFHLASSSSSYNTQPTSTNTNDEQQQQQQQQLNNNHDPQIIGTSNGTSSELQEEDSLGNEAAVTASEAASELSSDDDTDSDERHRLLMTPNSNNNNNNNNNASLCEQLAEIMHKNTSPLVSLVYYACYTFLFIFGIVGNSLTIYAMAKKREKTVTDLFIASLAISDILVCIFAVPITPTYLLYYESWVFGLTLCRVFTFAMSSSVYISTFTMIAIALIRYQLVVYPHRNWVSNWMVCAMTAFIWSLGILMTFPYLMHVDLIRTEDCPIKFCNEQWDHQSQRIKFSWITLVCQFLFPFLTVSFSYFAVYRKLQARQLMYNKSRAEGAHYAAVSARLDCSTAATLLHGGTIRAGGRGFGACTDPAARELHSAIELGSPPTSALRLAGAGSIGVGAGARTRRASSQALGTDQLPLARASSMEQISPVAGVGGVEFEHGGGAIMSCSLGAVGGVSSESSSSGNVNIIAHDNDNEFSARLAGSLGRDSSGAQHQPATDAEESTWTHKDVELEQHKQSEQLEQHLTKPKLPQERMMMMTTTTTTTKATTRPASSIGFLRSGSSSNNNNNNINNNNNSSSSVNHQRHTVLDLPVVASSARGNHKQVSLLHTKTKSSDILAIRERRIHERNRRLNQTNRKLVFIVSLFACSWLPLNVFNLVQDYIESVSESPYIKHIFLSVHLIACSSVCYNPILYAWMSDNYRQELRNILPASLIEKLNFLIGG